MADDLRARIVEALNTTPTKLLDGHPESLAFHAEQLTWDVISARHDRHNYMATCALCRGEAETLADAVLAVVQPEPDRLRTERDRLSSGVLRLGAEAHRRKWAYDAGEDRYGNPISAPAFNELHRIGNELIALRDSKTQPSTKE